MGGGVSVNSLYGFRFREPDNRRERKNEDGTRAFDIKQLWQRSHEILNMALLGHKNVDIAKVLNISPVTVSNTLNSSLGQEAISEKRKDRDDKFKELNNEVVELTVKSLKVYDKILSASIDPEDENFDPQVPLKMQKDTADTVMLELSGMRAPTKIDKRSLNMSLTTDEIEEFKRRGLDAAKVAGKLVVVDNES